MKRLLLDTHVLLWWLSDDAQLGKAARLAISDPRNQIYVSAVSTWEASINKLSGKLSAPDDLDAIVEEEGFSKLPITLFHGDQAGLLPLHHKDPFDRMLVAQAQSEGLVIVTNDEIVTQYNIRTMDARK
ncbi:MAG TPA: PIN domain nuclease [Gammaproteobacteria bacterium]|nr:PIN domain nuclease [Gammaproteobacteria bacterium]